MSIHVHYRCNFLKIVCTMIGWVHRHRAHTMKEILAETLRQVLFLITLISPHETMRWVLLPYFADEETKTKRS
jgi:hypothetical protein